MPEDAIEEPINRTRNPEELCTTWSDFYLIIMHQINNDAGLNETHKALLIIALNDLSECCQEMWQHMHRESAVQALNCIAIKVYEVLNHEDGAMHLLILVRAIYDAYGPHTNQDETLLLEALNV